MLLIDYTQPVLSKIGESGLSKMLLYPARTIKNGGEQARYKSLLVLS